MTGVADTRSVDNLVAWRRNTYQRTNICSSIARDCSGRQTLSVDQDLRVDSSPLQIIVSPSFFVGADIAQNDVSFQKGDRFEPASMLLRHGFGVDHWDTVRRLRRARLAKTPENSHCPAGRRYVQSNNTQRGLIEFRYSTEYSTPSGTDGGLLCQSTGSMTGRSTSLTSKHMS